MTRLRVRFDERGFTIIEVMVAAAIMLVGVLGTLALIDGANAQTDKNKRREAATNLARQVVESVQKVGWSNMTTANLATALQSQPGMADADAGAAGWQLENRGLKFTITASACSIDEPADGKSDHSTGTWCPGESGGTGDSDGEDLRRAQISVAAPGTSAATVVQTAVLSRKSFTSGGGGTTGGTTSTTSTTSTTGGGGGAGVAQNLNAIGCASTASGPFSFNTSATSTSGCYSGAWTSARYLQYGNYFCATSCVSAISGIGAVKFSLSTSAPAASVKWSLDGVVMGNATNTTGNTWEFVWDLADTYPNQTVDGGYDLSAQAFDSTGASSGSPVRLPLILNRFYPDGTAWQAPLGGWNPRWTSSGTLNTSLSGGPGIMEIEWYPTGSTSARMDRDLAGFQVARCQADRSQDCSNPNVPLATCDPGNATGGISPGKLTSYNYCDDESASTTLTIVKYKASPMDRTWNGLINAARAGAAPPSADLAISPFNGAPSPPTGFTATSSGGTVNLTWTVPSGTGDPTTGDCVEFFRIYRAPTSATNPTMANRFDRTPFGVVSANCGTQASTSYEDSGPCTGGCKYWITSVDRSLAESVVVGPVTG